MIRVFIADDHRLIRYGIREILEEAGDITVIGEAGNSHHVLTAIHDNQFDVLLLDISMSDGGGLKVLKELYQQKSEIKVLLLPLYVEEKPVMRALRSHIYGYLSKESSPEELIIAIRRIARGERHNTSEAAEMLVTDLDRNVQDANKVLSDREFQILRMLATGKSPTEIGKELALSIKTVSTYRARIISKLQLRNTAEIIRYAIMNRLTE